MKTQIRLAMLVLASASVPAFAQGVPECASIFNSSRNLFTADNAPADAVNRQCFLTVMPKDGPSSLAGFPQLAQYPQPQIGEGTYEILLSGGGGGGGAGGLFASGGGGAGAIPSKTTQYLTPGVYKLTIGTSGKGGSGGGNGGDGNPTNITKAYSNEWIAGFRGADTWTGKRAENYVVASAGNVPLGGPHNGMGAQGISGQGNGGSGGRKPDENGYGEIPAQDGGPMVVAGIPTGRPGPGARNDGGGGGGAAFGDGGAGNETIQAGNQGGNGFVRLRPLQLAQATPVVPVAPMAAPVQAAPAPYVAPARAKRDRN